MGFRFRKIFNIGKGFHINLSKHGLGYSWGTKFFRIGKTAKGKVRKTVTLPGTGLSHVTENDAKNPIKINENIVETKEKKDLKNTSFDDIINSFADKMDSAMENKNDK